MTQGEPSIEKIKSYLTQGQWSTAIAICQQALEKDDRRIELYPLLGKAYAQQGNLTDAIAAYTRAIGTEVNQAEIYAELGLLYSKKQELEQAARHYQQALVFNPNWAELQYNLAVVWHQLGDWEQAIAAYRRTLIIKPNYPAVYFNLGVLHDCRGELETAIENYYQAIELKRDFTRAYSNLGSTLAKQKKYEAAIAIFRQGLKVDPTWATLHNNLGQVYWFNKQPDKALISFEYAITLEPKMALAYHNLGKLWQQQGNYPQAIQCFQKVIQLEPNNIFAYSHCSDTLLKIGDLDSTVECWRKVIALQSAFVKFYCQRAFALEPTDLLEIAKISCARFLEALEKELDKSEVYHHLWRTYFYMGDILFEYGGIRQAAIYYQQALQIQPNETELYLRLGNCLAKQQRLDAATTIYQIGLTLQPDHPQICFQLGKILERQKEAGEAINYYEAVLNQKLHQVIQWDNLPNLFPAKERLSLLPQKIYHRTQDWARDCDLEDFSYVQVTWGDQLPPLTVEGKRQPSAISEENIGKQPNFECGGVNCLSCMRKMMDYFHPIQLGQNAYRCSFDQAAPMPASLPFVATIPQGRAWIAPQKNSWIICNSLAVITPNNSLLGDLSRYYPWFLPECPYQERAEYHTLFRLDTLPVIEEIEGKVAVLSGLAGHVYYHWMFDILPRIELIQQSGIELEEIDWFLVNSIDKPYQRETLNILGIPENKILASDRHSHIRAAQLIAPSFPGYLDWVPPGTIKFLRRTFLAQVNFKSNFGTRIYISRERAKNRQIVNEAEVKDLLGKLGFQTIFLEELSVLEQVALFAKAEVIVAPHGSGLTNLVFCSPQTIVIELFSPNYVRTDYWIISQQLKLQHYYSIGESFDCSSLRNLMYQNPLTEDILVNIASLSLILKTAQIIR
ncbi:MAG: hypothetical protein Tsb0014_11240 [Pleurocapsa sp.]